VCKLLTSNHCTPTCLSCAVNDTGSVSVEYWRDLELWVRGSFKVTEDDADRAMDHIGLLLYTGLPL